MSYSPMIRGGCKSEWGLLLTRDEGDLASEVKEVVASERGVSLALSRHLEGSRGVKESGMWC